MSDSDTPPIQAGTEANIAPFVPPRFRWLRKHPTLIVGLLLLLAVAALSIAAPWIATHDPQDIDPLARMQPPSAEHWFGTDALGRDVFSRAVWGGQVSMIVGASVAVLATVFGIVLGLLAGFVRRIDGFVMRVMDGLMAIPAILIAIALVAMWRGSLATVVVAIAIPEIPRVTRLVRSLVLTIREEPYVEAAVSLGTPPALIMWRHILPNTIAPLIVQGTFICASGILVEAILSFLGVGLPPEIPTWGNVMAEGRAQFNEYPHNIFFPGIFLAVTVLAVNILGDGLRDTLDPKMAKRT
jgi:peptide/nickel transport system permease protein